MRSRFLSFALTDRSEKVIKINKEFEDFEGLINSAESIIGVISVS
jgi:hypothetical protein